MRISDWSSDVCSSDLYAASFHHYDRGNRLRRALIRHDAGDFSAEAAATADTFSAAFITRMGTAGCPAPDPILIVRLPRSGSTRAAQILASNTQLEGPMKLPELIHITDRIQSLI